MLVSVYGGRTTYVGLSQNRRQCVCVTQWQWASSMLPVFGQQWSSMWHRGIRYQALDTSTVLLHLKCCLSVYIFKVIKGSKWFCWTVWTLTSQNEFWRFALKESCGCFLQTELLFIHQNSLCESLMLNKCVGCIFFLMKPAHSSPEKQPHVAAVHAGCYDSNSGLLLLKWTLSYLMNIRVTCLF